LPDESIFAQKQWLVSTHQVGRFSSSVELNSSVFWVITRCKVVELWPLKMGPRGNTEISLKSVKNNEYFTLRRFDIFNDISLHSSKNRKCFGQKLYRKPKHTFYVQWIFFFSENRTVYEIIPKNVVETEGPQMTSQYGAYALHAGIARLHACMRMYTPTRPGTYTHSRTHAHAYTQINMYYLLLFHGNNDSRTRLDVMLYVHCVSCYFRFCNWPCAVNPAC
jgi:hypothetical protein